MTFCDETKEKQKRENSKVNKSQNISVIEISNERNAFKICITVQSRFLEPRKETIKSVSGIGVKLGIQRAREIGIPSVYFYSVTQKVMISVKIIFLCMASFVPLVEINNIKMRIKPISTIGTSSLAIKRIYSSK